MLQKRVCFNPFALRKAKIVNNFGLSECSRVKGKNLLLKEQIFPLKVDPREVRKKRNGRVAFPERVPIHLNFHITCFRKLVCETLRQWLIEITGIPLNNTVDMFCAQYQHTGLLLPSTTEKKIRGFSNIFWLHFSVNFPSVANDFMETQQDISKIIIRYSISVPVFKAKF